MNRRLTFCDACARLGSKKNIYDDSNDNEEEVGKVEDGLLELQMDEEDTGVDDEEDVKVFFEGESYSSDDEEPTDRESDEQDDDWVVSPNSILYTSQPMPA